MPTYEYGCRDCGNQWEEVQKITENALDTCPKCSKKTAQRLISGGSFILKGGGWYADLYSSAKPSQKTESSGSASATPPAASSGDSAKTTSTPPAAAPAASSAGSSSGSSSGSSGSSPAA